MEPLIRPDEQTCKTLTSRILRSWIHGDYAFQDVQDACARERLPLPWIKRISLKLWYEIVLADTIVEPRRSETLHPVQECIGMQRQHYGEGCLMPVRR